MISFDNSKDGGNATNTSISISYTNSGNMLFVGIRGSVNAGITTNVAYAGVNMAQVAAAVKDSRYDYLWYLANPATGANNVVITNNVSDYCETTIASYFNSNGTLEGGNSTASSGNTTGTVTTTKANDWMVMFGGATGAISAGASTTLRQANGSGASGIFDSNGGVAAGSNSLIMNTAAGNTGILIAGFEPSLAGGAFLYNLL